MVQNKVAPFDGRRFIDIHSHSGRSRQIKVISEATY